MKKSNIQFCADAGGRYCPCHLAYSGDCIKCSLIRGEKVCDCKWQGVCIYNQLQHDKISGVNERKEVLCDILDSEEIGIDLYLIKIQIPKCMTKDLCEPGAYVFLKDRNKENTMFNVPISVMDIDEENNILEVIVHPRGVKTKPIVKSDKVFVKAPYFNGIFGIKEVKSNINQNCVVILNGLSQVNSINVIKRLIKNNNHVEVFLNTKGGVLDIVKEKILNMGVNINDINLRQDKDLIADYIRRENISFVYSGASVGFSKDVMNIVDSVDKNIKFAISNNNLICCGEGICGACVVNMNGCQVKTCKAQLDSREYLHSIK